jgi:2-polyprenyl-3-methyl-5-hydroxy-6-metoxy-1,4-benzoquinol methylase
MNMVNNFEKSVNEIKKTRSHIFSNPENLECVSQCPICEGKQTQHTLTIYNANYHQCLNCLHYYLIERPNKIVLEDFYSQNQSYQSTYTDKESTETRVQQVAMPKVEWVINHFERVYGRKPKAILDVGAGSGHFVYACRQLGIKADGIELSHSGRQFSKNVFGIELIDADFYTQWDQFSDYELISFWGVIEHTPYPLKMLESAYQILADLEGMVVAEVPRWDCLSTAIQSQYNSSVVRHLDPHGHLNIFTDSSLATSLIKTNFKIISAWYFGMDAYELVTQLSYKLKDNRIIENLKEMIPSLQKQIDSGYLSDNMVFAGIPKKTLK